MNEALIFVSQTFLGLLSIMLVLRFYMQTVNVPPQHPLYSFTLALTNFVVLPTRRFIPGVMGYDLSCLFIAWFAETLLFVTTRSLAGYELDISLGIFLLAGLAVIKVLIYIVLFSIILQAVLSWVNPYSPTMPMLNSINRPILSIFQRKIPLIGGVDLSPLFAVVACQILLMWPLASAERYFYTLV